MSPYVASVPHVMQRVFQWTINQSISVARRCAEFALCEFATFRHHIHVTYFISCVLLSACRACWGREANIPACWKGELTSLCTGTNPSYTHTRAHTHAHTHQQTDMLQWTRVVGWIWWLTISPSGVSQVLARASIPPLVNLSHWHIMRSE